MPAQLPTPLGYKVTPPSTRHFVVLSHDFVDDLRSGGLYYSCFHKEGDDGSGYDEYDDDPGAHLLKHTCRQAMDCPNGPSLCSLFSLLSSARQAYASLNPQHRPQGTSARNLCQVLHACCRYVMVPEMCLFQGNSGCLSASLDHHRQRVSPRLGLLHQILVVRRNGLSCGREHTPRAFSMARA